MADQKGKIAIGVLGQWASGKSTAAETLVQYLGGEGKVTFITDRVLVARQALNHILNSEPSRVTRSFDDKGRQRFEGDLATVFIGPDEMLEEVEPNMLLFDLHDAVYDDLPRGALSWIDVARVELGQSIRTRIRESKPVVVEAGFGTNTMPRGENPLRHTLNDLFVRFEEAGVEPHQVKWIIVEASYERRAARNRRRKDRVPSVEFDRFAADGGDLDPDEQKKWEAQGARFERVCNDHDDVERFRADIISALETLFTGELAAMHVGS